MIFPSELTSYRLKFKMALAGVPIGGLAGIMNVWRAKSGEAPSVQIVTAGVGRTIVEVDNANMLGVYEMVFLAADLDTPGEMALEFAAAGADDLTVIRMVYPRQAFGSV